MYPLLIFFSILCEYDVLHLEACICFLHICWFPYSRSGRPGRLYFGVILEVCVFSVHLLIFLIVTVVAQVVLFRVFRVPAKS